MAPPVKRQKRLNDLSLDDEGSDSKSAPKPVPTKSKAKATKSNSRGSCTATQSGPNAIPRENIAKPRAAGRAQTSRPISLFFGAGTQAQQPKNQKPPEAVTPEVQDHEDLIVDDSPLENVIDQGGKLTKTALDGRKKALPRSYGNAATTNRPSLQGGGHRFIIPEHASNVGISSGTSVVAKAKSNAIDLRPWAERYGPTSLEELMVHKKKVSDVRSWLENALRGHDCKRLLILKGPSGAGKTATVSMLAKAMDVDVSEWKNPVGSEFSSEAYLSMSALFEDFLARSGRFNRLELADRNPNAIAKPSRTHDAPNGKTRSRIILMEEFPHTFSSTSIALRSFRSSVLQYLAFNAPAVGACLSKKQHGSLHITPVVMIITETRLTTTTAASDSFTAHRLLGPELLSHPCVSTLEFNPVASTYLTKALDLVVQKEARHSGRRRVPGPAVFKELGGVGDIRSAIGSLEFLCLRAEDGDDWGGRVALRAKKGAITASMLTKLEKDSLETITQRESTLGLFHAVGKVVYNKRDDFTDGGAVGEPPVQPPSHLPGSVRTRIAQVSANQLVDETGTDIRTFIAALHENFVLSCEGISFTDNLDGCIEALSDSDILGSSRGGRSVSSGSTGSHTFQGAPSDALRQDEICFHVAVRGLLFALPDPVKRRTHPISGGSGGNNDAHRMFYPTSIRLSRQVEEIDGLVGQWTDRLRAGGSALGNAFGRYSRQLTHLPSRQEVERSEGIAERRSGPGPDGDGLEPFRTSLGCTKKELVVERLPYITKIEQRNAGSTHLVGLEKITQFHAIRPPSDEVSEDEDAREGAPVSDWTTDGPTEATNVTGSSPRASLRQEGWQASKAASTLVLPAEEEVGQLYLSDDDIEDD